MIATTAGYDIVFLVHILAALSTVIVFVVMRMSAVAVAKGADSAIQQARFPPRRNWGARLLHLLPITGLIMSLTGDSSVSLTKPWIGVGILCYLLAAGHLEARTLPLEAMIGDVIAHDGTASTESGRKLVLSVDVLLGLVGVALIAMLVQF
jgi:hypothetical protein